VKKIETFISCKRVDSPEVKQLKRDLKEKDALIAKLQKELQAAE